MNTAPASLTENVTTLALGAEIAGLGWLGTTCAFALADGRIILAHGESQQEVTAHPNGAILVLACDGKRLVTGGDDGRVAVTTNEGAVALLADAKGSWIDAVALHASGAIAYSVGKRVVAQDDKGREKSWTAPSSVRGLAFAPKGYRLAAAHYGGATLWYPNLDAAPEALEWKGSHLDAIWSPDGRFVITSMQENALHGWRLQPDRGHMRMSGYAAKPRSLSWSFGGAWLATSGAEAVIIWPFSSKEGPTGKPPRECGVRPSRVTRVAFHPNVNVLAAGYEDGMILMIRLDDSAELLVRASEPGTGITALGWNKSGQHLAFGGADGSAGILTLPG